MEQMHNSEEIARLRETVAGNETEHRSFRRRLDALEEATRRQGDILITLQRQGDAIESMTRALREIKLAVEQVDQRVGKIEREPGESWKKVTFEIIKYIVIAAVGAAIGIIVR